MSRILVVVAHPDDEVLGCGGTIAKYSKEQHDVYCIILGEGVMGRMDATMEDLEPLKEERKKAADVLGISSVKCHHSSDNAFDGRPLLNYVHALESDLKDFGDMDYVLTHFPYDLNVDHQMTARAVQTVFRPQPNISCKTLLFFETLSSTEWALQPFNPSLYVDITDTLSDKVDAFKCYKSEMRELPHPRSTAGLLNLALRRGVEIGFEAAEAFMIGYMKVETIK